MGWWRCETKNRAQKRASCVFAPGLMSWPYRAALGISRIKTDVRTWGGDSAAPKSAGLSHSILLEPVADAVCETRRLHSPISWLCLKANQLDTLKSISCCICSMKVHQLCFLDSPCKLIAEPPTSAHPGSELGVVFTDPIHPRLRWP
jgi:hypothetical protein